MHNQPWNGRGMDNGATSDTTLARNVGNLTGKVAVATAGGCGIGREATWTAPSGIRSRCACSVIRCSQERKRRGPYCMPQFLSGIGTSRISLRDSATEELSN